MMGDPFTNNARTILILFYSSTSVNPTRVSKKITSFSASSSFSYTMAAVHSVLKHSSCLGASEYCHANFTRAFRSDPILYQVFASRNLAVSTRVMVMALRKWIEGNYRKRIDSWMEL